ncbi:MAG TPA: cobalt ABC transporter permease [Geomonas sp.]|nr:cobalt ABC transporter permease [Geomonas sp.]
MADQKGKSTKAMTVAVVMVLTIVTAYFFTHSRTSWTGVDEAVVEKIAKEHGREARPPLIDPGNGDLLLFVFLMGGAVGGFVAGYYWRDLTKKG